MLQHLPADQFIHQPAVVICRLVLGRVFCNILPQDLCPGEHDTGADGGIQQRNIQPLGNFSLYYPSSPPLYLSLYYHEVEIPMNEETAAEAEEIPLF